MSKTRYLSILLPKLLQRLQSYMIYATFLVFLGTVLCLALPVNGAPNSARLDTVFGEGETPPITEAAPTSGSELMPDRPSTEKGIAPATGSEVKPTGLHRLDFRLEGKSCPSCLLSIQTKIKCFPGVEDAAVMLRRPFGVSVIYQAGKTTPDCILSMIKAKEPSIKILDIADSKITIMPLPLIPPFFPKLELPKANPVPITKPLGSNL